MLWKTSIHLLNHRNCESDGKSANRTEMGSKRNTTGTINRISDLPAFRKIPFFASKRQSRTRAVNIGINGEPRSIAIIRVFPNLLDPDVFVSRINSSTAEENADPLIIFSTTLRTLVEISESVLCEKTCIALIGDTPAEIIKTRY